MLDIRGDSKLNNQDTMTISVEKEILEYHQHKKRRKIVKLVIALAVWLLIFVYLATPLSMHLMMHVKGNVYLSEKEIIEMAGIKRTWWWATDSKKVASKLESYENIDNVSISMDINGLNISIVEKYPLAIRNGKYVMNIDSSLKEKDEYPYKDRIKNLIDISEISDDYVSTFISQFIYLKLENRELFTSAKMDGEKIIVMSGKINEECYFIIRLNLESLSIKLKDAKFDKIKNEILGNVKSGSVKYDVDNPCIVEYDYPNIYEYRFV